MLGDNADGIFTCWNQNIYFVFGAMQTIQTEVTHLNAEYMPKMVL